MIDRERVGTGEETLRHIAEERERFLSEHGKAAEKAIAQGRYQTAEEIAAHCITQEEVKGRTLTDWIDLIACNKFSGPIILAATIYGIYYLAIVQGYNLTSYWWPVLGSFRSFVASLLPTEGFVFDPILRSMVLWVVGGIVAVANYIPIFAILFALIAILEDTGYMARVAFILDRLFRPFGLHGQSALPMMLGGMYVGGCAIPGVMACRAIKDEKARLATIMVVPLMNCMAKIPFYALLVGMFFASYKGPVMFIIATITILVALAVSKVLTSTILKRKETAPFVLEMPPYHVPTAQGILRRMVERVWLFAKKIITVVLVVMIALYLLLNFPGLNQERKNHYDTQIQGLIQSFLNDMGAENSYAMFLDTPEKLAEYGAYLDSYRAQKRGASGEAAKAAVDRRFMAMNPESFKIANKGKVPIEESELSAFKGYLASYETAKQEYLALYEATEPGSREALKRAFYQSWYDLNPEFFQIVRTGRVVVKGDTVTDEDAKLVNKVYRDLDRGRQGLRMGRHDEVLEMSLLGRFGTVLEPFTKYAGFNWRVNIGLISSFAAKEGVVATLGAIYQSPPGSREAALEERLTEKEKGWTPLHAAAMILFMAMYPPCIPTLLMVKVQAGLKWMLFTAIYPIVLGLIMALLVFSGGNLLGLSGLQSMIALYCLVAVVTVALGFIKPKPQPE